VAGLVCAAAWAAGPDDLPYPQGKRFPLGLYSIETLEEMQAEAKNGWNIAHSYGFKPEYFEVVKQAGWVCLTFLKDKEEASARATIEKYASGPVGWWDLPEELRYWRADEFGQLKNLSAWSHKYDPQRRPNFMYIPGHHDAEAVSKYVPYLDIIGAGTYTEYAHMPRAWVRWRMEQTIEGIRLAGAKVGRDYLNGEKTPIGIPMCFYNQKDMDVISPVEAYHDFYSCLASGAHGILVFSYWHRRDADVLQKTMAAYSKAAAEVAGPEDLGQALLFGKGIRVGLEVLQGPQKTYNFRPYGAKEDVTYPALNALAMEYDGRLFIVVVNSTEQAVRAKITGLPARVTKLVLPFEKALDKDKKETAEQRSVDAKDGACEDDFGWLGVHVYKAAL